MQSTVGNRVVDVVCGMLIDPETAAAKVEYRGKTYYFCAMPCKLEFVRNPERYLQPASSTLYATRELQL